MLLAFIIGSHSILDMLVVLGGTYKNPLVPKKCCNGLSLSLGNEPHLWFFYSLGVTTGSVDSPLLPLAMDASSESPSHFDQTTGSL